MRKLPFMCVDFDVTLLCDIYTGGFLQQQQQQHNIYDESCKFFKLNSSMVPLSHQLVFCTFISP